jgi:hypothetical protein
VALICLSLPDSISHSSYSLPSPDRALSYLSPQPGGDSLLWYLN